MDDVKRLLYEIASHEIDECLTKSQRRVYYDERYHDELVINTADAVDFTYDWFFENFAEIMEEPLRKRLHEHLVSEIDGILVLEKNVADGLNESE